MLTSQILDNDVQKTDINMFKVDWFCLDKIQDTLVQCRDSKGFYLTFESGFSLVVEQDKLSLNKFYIFQAIAQRVSDSLTKQIASVSINTGKAILILVSDKNKLSLVTFQEMNQIELSYTTTLQKDIKSCHYLVQFKEQQTGQIKSVQSKSNKISFIVEDIFPNFNFSQPSVIINFLVIDNTLLSSISAKEEIIMQIRQPPVSCIIQIDEKGKIGFQDIVQISLQNCETNRQQFSIQFFYYYGPAKLQEEIESSGKIINRRMISISSQNFEYNTLLPSGDLVIIAVLRGLNNVRANFTKQATMADNFFNQNTYEEFIFTQYSSSQKQILNSQEILMFQIIVEAIEQYEKKNPSYNPSSDIQSIKNQILLRLYDQSWQVEANEIYQLSLDLISRIKKTKIQISSSFLLNLKTLNEQALANTIKSIQDIGSSQLTQSQRQYYQQIIETTISDFMKNVNSINEWTTANNENAISQLTNAMNGLFLTMILNQSLIIVEMEGTQLCGEKLDFVNLMNKFYQDQTTEPTTEQKNLDYQIQIQTWKETHPLYRDELLQINQQYVSQATKEQLVIIQKTYPIKILSISNEKEFKNPILIEFGEINKTEKLVCIQRKKSGKWVSDSCSQIIQNNGGKKQIICKCQTPGVTSLISDVADLFSNESVKDVFSEKGIMRIFELENWYEHASIWTLIGLNIIFIILLFVGYKFDKRDKQNDLKKAFLQRPNKNNLSPLNQEKPQENLFMQIKNKQTKSNSQNQKSEIPQKLDTKQLNTEHELVEKSRQSDFDVVQQQQQQQQLGESIQCRPQNDQSIKDKIQCNFSFKKQEIIIQEQQQNNILEGKKLSGFNINNNEINFKENKEIIVENLGQFYSNPQPDNKEVHIYIDNSKSLSEICNHQGQDKLKNGQSDNQSAIKINKIKFEELNYTSKDEKEEKMDSKKKIKINQQFKFIKAKNKLEEYLALEKKFLGVLVFHSFFSTFIVYNSKFSRVRRFIIYYNKMIWLLTLNSIFGKNISLIQVFVLSIVTTLILLIITKVFIGLFSIKRFKKFALIITSLFLLFCYYSILVVISGQEPFEANLWISSYFATVVLNEYIFGIGICFLMYSICKRIIGKVANPFLLEILGTRLLIQAFKI